MSHETAARGPTEPVPTLHTVGYQGRSVADLVAVLSGSGVRQLVDIRQVAWSRKPGFSKSQLADSLYRDGILYQHLPALGSPKALRDRVRSDGAYESFFAEYRAYLEQQTDALDEVVALASNGPVALLCFEADHRECHRSVVAEALTAKGLGPANHL